MRSLSPLTHDRRTRRWRVAARTLATLLLLLAPFSIAAAVETRNFDHMTTGFELLGQHRYVPCEGCHANAIFKGTPMACGACHGIGTAVRASAKPATHILSTDQCQACHTPWSWNPAVDFDHTQALGSCSSCHYKGGPGSGFLDPQIHIATDLDCNACHTTLSWGGSLFNHAGVTTGCATCHNGVNADGLSANHFPISASGVTAVPCEACHSTTEFTTFATATINHPAVQSLTCASCHETAAFIGMHPSTNTAAGDSRPNSTLDKAHPTTGDCILCHNTISFLDPTVQRPSNHIPSTAICSQCHTTAGNWALYDVVGVHQGVTSGCNACHGPGTGPFAGPPPSNVITIVGWPGSSHFPVGSVDCSGSGCHTATNVNPGGFKIGTASPAAPTLTVAGHATVAAGGVAGCQGCHETAPYTGMVASTATAWGDSRPTAYDTKHPTSGDCGPACHTTTPTFVTNVTAAKPSNHIPTSAACATCHTTANDYTQYSSPGVHTGVTGCLACHGSTAAPTFTLTTPVFSILSTPSTHIAFGTADCNGSGCHSTSNVTPGGGGFKIGTANISTPTLTAAGHATVAAAGVLTCSNCHETAPYLGMIASTATVAGDSRPTAFDAKHPTTGDCGNCHVTTPTFATNLLPTATKPSNHLPTSAPCAQCHTTVGNFAVYAVAGVHQGVTACLPCHGPSVGPFAGPPPSNTITVVGWPGASHFPIGTADCNASGCHSTTNTNPGGFKIGTASTASPTLSVAGHATIASAGVAGCQGCHVNDGGTIYTGMIGGTATAWGDTRPTLSDKNHPTTGDCNGCHTTTPTFFTNQSGSSAKPSNHIPTSAACAQCHTTAGNYAAYVMGATGHAGITNNCAQCHAYGLSFYNMAAPTLKQPTSGATGHIPGVPPNGTTAIACELCHSPSVFTTFSGTVMKHATVTTMACKSCHETGMTWQTNTGTRLWTRPNGHKGTQDCGGSGCHNARDKTAVRPVAAVSRTPTTATGTAAKGAGTAASTGPAPRPGTASAAAAGAPSAASGPFNHTTVTGQACVSCHNGTAATGKPASHIATTNSCQSCHTTLTWLPVKTVDHSQVTGSCVSCHNGTTATGKPAKHIATTAGCETCHTTNGWLPARFDHKAVASGTCATCHNGVQAIGKPSGHIATTADCSQCHGTLAWKPALIDHSTFVGTCARCHNNVGATGLPPNHFLTHLDCSSCHSYPDWSVIRFHHTATAAYPSDHRVALTCQSCHTTNAEKVPYAAPAYAGNCAGCHAKDYVVAGHPKTVKGAGQLFYTVGELANCTGACHVYRDATLTTIATPEPGNHHRVTDAAFR